MLRSLSNHWNRFRDRNFHSSAVKMSQEVAKHEPTPSNEDFNSVRVRPIDRYFLVCSGKYKGLKEVPDRISRATLLKSHSLCRVKICNYMIGVTLFAALCYVISGKRDAEKGLTVVHMNRKWHEEYNRKADEAHKNS